MSLSGGTTDLSSTPYLPSLPLKRSKNPHAIGTLSSEANVQFNSPFSNTQSPRRRHSTTYITTKYDVTTNDKLMSTGTSQVRRNSMSLLPSRSIQQHYGWNTVALNESGLGARLPVFTLDNSPLKKYQQADESGREEDSGVCSSNVQEPQAPPRPKPRRVSLPTLVNVERPASRRSFCDSVSEFACSDLSSTSSAIPRKGRAKTFMDKTSGVKDWLEGLWVKARSWYLILLVWNSDKYCV